MKRTRVWRVMGTDPGVYVFKEQYGGGTPCPHTVAVDHSRILMLGREGVCCYVGEMVIPFEQEFARKVIERITPEALSETAACLWKGTYYCALPLDGSAVNNAVLMFNTRENTWLLRNDVQAESFLPMEDALYFTSSQTPGCIWLWQEDCMAAGQANAVSERNVPQTKKKLTYKERLELEALERTLDDLNAEKSEIEQRLSSGTAAYDEIAQLSARYAQIKEELELAELRWLELSC
jgi:hypothetical protein